MEYNRSSKRMEENCRHSNNASQSRNHDNKSKRKYVDKKSKYTRKEMSKLESTSSTVYVGKLVDYGSNIVTQSQIYTIFSQCGPIKRIIMGIYREDHSPAGFCFVEYYSHDDALSAVRWLNKIPICDRKIDVDIDYGFEEGRQFKRYHKFHPIRKDEHRRRPPLD